MTLKVPFASDDAAGFYVGESASVILDGSFETLAGRVTAVSAADTVLTGNRIVRYVTVSVTNPGGLTNTQVATATINGCGSSENATLSYKAAEDVTAASGGTVAAVNVKEGGNVSAGQTIVTFASNAANDSVQSAEDNLQNAELSMYHGTAPFGLRFLDSGRGFSLRAVEQGQLSGPAGPDHSE